MNLFDYTCVWVENLENEVSLFIPFWFSVQSGYYVCVCLGLVSVFLFLGYFDRFDLILLSFEIGCRIT